MDREIPLTGHLEELRQRLLVTLAVVFVITVLAFNHAGAIITLLKVPAGTNLDKLVFFSPTEAFMVYFKVSFLVALIFSSPLILYQVWAFISPAMGENGRRGGVFFLLFSTVAFAAGVSFGYFMLLPAAIKFLIGFAQGVLTPMISAEQYTSFVSGLLLGCGLVFEMPVISFLLARMGILQYQMLRNSWKYALIIIFIVAAIVTPTPDPFNMILMALPMLMLYELSIWVVRVSASPLRPAKLSSSVLN